MNITASTIRHLAALALLLNIAACTAGPTAAPPPLIKQAKDLAPLGPCPASSWKPEAPPPTASVKVSMVLLAVQEWGRFGKQTVTYPLDGPPWTETFGIREKDAPERVTDYWRAVGQPGRSGMDDIAWSAAFMSWVVASAGVPRDLFCPDQRHTIYVERIVERARRPGAALIPHRIEAYAPKVGDLVCASRADSGTKLDNLNRGAGHCDIVVEVKPGQIHTIGGNVGDSVSRSIFPSTASGLMTPLSGRPFFAVIENRLP
jgi:hypothetical protein